MKSIYNLQFKKGDSLEDTIEKNEKLLTMIRKLNRQLKDLQTKNKTLQQAFDKTEVYLQDVVVDKNLNEVMECIKEWKPFVSTDKCAMCQNKGVKKINFNDFYVVLCNKCGHKKRVQNEPEEKTE